MYLVQLGSWRVGPAEQDPAMRDEVVFSMFYVYVLKSNVNGDLYVGSTQDLRERFRLHNNGKVKSTKVNKPWTLVYYEAYKSKEDATKREFELKIHAAKNRLKEQIKNSFEI